MIYFLIELTQAEVVRLATRKTPKNRTIDENPFIFKHFNFNLLKIILSLMQQSGAAI